MKQMLIPDQKQRCSICSKEATVVALEKVPGGYILYESVHDDGSKPCRFTAGFKDLKEAIAVDTVTDDPKIQIRCPECNELGFVMQELDLTKGQADFWNYFVRHTYQKHLVTAENRGTVLKALGRYIYRELTERHGKKRGPYRQSRVIKCPKCNQPGYARRDDGRMMVYHGKKQGGNGQEHSMKTDEERKLWESRSHNSGYQRKKKENEEKDKIIADQKQIIIELEKKLKAIRDAIS